MNIIPAALALILTGALPLFAQEVDHSAHGGHSTAPWAAAYDAANAAMHQGMAIAYSDNADADFVRGMIAHHQGAVDMAKIQLEHGKDPEIRALAEAIIAAQIPEIEQMQAWLAAQGG